MSDHVAARRVCIGKAGNHFERKDVTMRTLKLLAGLALLPALLTAQQSPIDRLRAVLPADVADKVIAIVTDATSRGLPGQAIADRALEAIA